MASLRETFGGRLEQGGITLSIQPSAQTLSSRMEAWAELIKDNSAFFADAEDLIANHTRRNFDTQGGSTGRRWASLSPRYEQFKGEVRPGRPILEFDGHLRRAAVDRGRGYKSKIGKDRATFGIDPSFSVPGGVKLADYARAHAFGIPGKLPARPPYRWDPDIRNRGSLGFALSQIRQAHIVFARRQALGVDSKALGPFGDAERNADRIEAIKRQRTR